MRRGDRRRRAGDGRGGRPPVVPGHVRGRVVSPRPSKDLARRDPFGVVPLLHAVDDRGPLRLRERDEADARSPRRGGGDRSRHGGGVSLHDPADGRRADARRRGPDGPAGSRGRGRSRREVASPDHEGVVADRPDRSGVRGPRGGQGGRGRGGVESRGAPPERCRGLFAPLRGLDSAVLTSLAIDRRPDWRTFTAVGGDGTSDPDRDAARLLADAFGRPSVEVPVLDRPESPLDRWRRMVGALGVLLGTPNEIAINALAEAVRDAGIKVAISGEGADEIFGGYEPVLRIVQAIAASSPTEEVAAASLIQSIAWIPPHRQSELLHPDWIEAIGPHEALVRETAASIADGARRDPALSPMAATGESLGTARALESRVHARVGGGPSSVRRSTGGGGRVARGDPRSLPCRSRGSRPDEDDASKGVRRSASIGDRGAGQGQLPRPVRALGELDAGGCRGPRGRRPAARRPRCGAGSGARPDDRPGRWRTSGPGRWRPGWSFGPDRLGAWPRRFDFDFATPSPPISRSRLREFEGPAVIGRSRDADVMLVDPGISRRHAKLVPGDMGEWLVEDLHSTRGTKVNGRRLDPGDMHSLVPGDLVEINPWSLLVLDDGPRSDRRPAERIGRDGPDRGCGESTAAGEIRRPGRCGPEDRRLVGRGGGLRRHARLAPGRQRPRSSDAAARRRARDPRVSIRARRRDEETQPRGFLAHPAGRGGSNARGPSAWRPTRTSRAVRAS